ncbi:MAG: hypothetical protein IPM68_08525 [Flavobacteriales bacterium]|nr:hypothetical protein [Flavobacteriales bacterium]
MSSGARGKIAFSFYELYFENRFLKSKGTAFQALFEEVMNKAHPGQFMACKPWGRMGDRKNDGYLASERTLFQVYGPEEMTAATAVQKIEEDFLGALPHWERYFNTWVFVHNAEALSPPIQQKLMELRTAHSHIAIETWNWERMRLKFNGLSTDAKRSMFGYAPTEDAQQHLSMLDVQQVLDHIAAAQLPVSESTMVVNPGKIAYNRLSPNVEILLKTGMQRVIMVDQYFDGIADPTYPDRLAQAFKERYMVLRDADPAPHPDDIFTELMRWAGRSERSTSGDQVAILTVLAYFFEQCEIFEAPPPATP